MRLHDRMFAERTIYFNPSQLNYLCKIKPQTVEKIEKRLDKKYSLDLPLFKLSLAGHLRLKYVIEMWLTKTQENIL